MRIRLPSSSLRRRASSSRHVSTASIAGDGEHDGGGTTDIAGDPQQTPTFFSSSAASRLLSSLSSNSRPAGDHSLRLLADMSRRGFPPANPFQFTKLLNKLCRSGRTAAAWELLHSVMDSSAAMQAPFFNVLLTGLAKDREFEKMNVLFLEMKAAGVQPTVVTFGILVNHLCKSRRVDEALKVVEKMPNPDVVTFNTLIDGFCKTGKVEEGLSLLQRMRAFTSPNVVTYNCLIAGLCAAGEIDRARGLTAEMEKEGLKPNSITLNTLVDGMCRHGRVSTGLSFFKKFRPSWEAKRGACVGAYTSLIGAFLHSNNVGMARKLFDEMSDHGCSPDAVTFFALIAGLAQSNHIDEALRVALIMREKGMKLDVKCYNLLISKLFNTLISALIEGGELASAKMWLKKMVTLGIEPSVVTFTSLIHGYVQSGDLRSVEELRRSMAAAGVEPNAVTYNVLIQSMCEKEQDVEAAMATLMEMKEKGVLANTNTYNVVFSALRDKKLTAEATELMDRMEEEGCSPDMVTIEILMEWLPSVGEMTKLKRFMRRMVEESRTDGDCK